MTSAEQASAIADQLDERYLVDTLVELAKVPTEVPLGPVTFMEPDDPKLVHYVQSVLRPKIQDLGAYDIQDVPLNQLLVRLGDGRLGRFPAAHGVYADTAQQPDAGPVLREDSASIGVWV